MKAIPVIIAALAVVILIRLGYLGRAHRPRHPSTAAHLVVAQRPPELGQVSHPLLAAVTEGLGDYLARPEAGSADIRDRVPGGPLLL